MWWDDPLQPLNLLRNKKVMMTSAYSGGILDAIKKRNEDLAIVWDGQVWDMVVWVIPKGTVSLKEALDFIVFASDPKRMAVHANHIAYAPVRKSAMAFITTWKVSLKMLSVVWNQAGINRSGTCS